jgi:hypothetical protein
MDTTLSAQAMLQSWEQAQGQPAPRRSLTLLQTAWPDVEAQAWGRLPIGERDRWLLTLRETLFGGELDTVASCPACGETLELQFPTSALQTEPAHGDEAPSPPTLRHDDWQIGFRLPGSDDLAEVLATSADRDGAVARLLERCILELSHDGVPARTADLPPALVERVQQEMARHDPGADNRVALDCPACGHHFERGFDIGAYLWDELDDWAHKTLAEVHLLASAYGWSETQVLALSAARRRHYIALVEGR